MIESILSRGGAERDVIRTGKCARVTHPARQESDRCWCSAVGWQWGAITKGDFHVGRWQWTGKHLCDTAVGAVCSDQERTVPLGTRIADHVPTVFDSFSSPRGDLCCDDVSAGIKS